MSAARMASVLNPSNTPQSEPLPNRNMVLNNAGGYTFEIDDWKRLDRFLILGSTGGTYYVSEKTLTLDNAKAVSACIAKNGVEVVRRIVAVSDAGRAPKNSPAIFALALAAEQGSEDTKAAAYQALTKVCRTGTHIFEFAQAKKQLGGAFGSGCRRAIGRWYTEKTTEALAYQLVKYRNREGFTHRDLLRLVRPTMSVEANRVVRWTVAGKDGMAEVTKGSTKDGAKQRFYGGEVYDALPAVIRDFDALQEMAAGKAGLGAVVDFLKGHKLPWEAVPTEYLKDPRVWGELLPDLPLNATVRNLGRMTANGLLTPLSTSISTIVGRLTDPSYIAKSRMHPMSLLIAQKIYAQGRGDKGSLTWSPIPQIIDALNDAFYLAFGNVPKTGKRFLLALDVSGSMSSPVMGSPLSCREGAAAMALITANVEPNYHIVGFTAGNGGFGERWSNHKATLTEVNISPKMRLDTVVQQMESLPMGGTDCALPMIWALQNKVPVDCFSVYTDNETWHGQIHPCQALKEYRSGLGIAAKSAVVAMTASKFSIADPNDTGMLDVVGFDAVTPSAIAAFAEL